VKVTFWGTRGSIATPGAETVRYGGNTSCVGVTGTAKDHALILDAGTGIRRLGAALPPEVSEVDLLLSHLHLDHILGLGFFAPLFRPELIVRIWGPAATTSLLERLGRYLSPPLFPIRLRDVGCQLELREVPGDRFTCGEFVVRSEAVIHPDLAVGYRIESEGATLAYLPDHEPALSPEFPLHLDWISGAALATGVDLLIHDAQYTSSEYQERMGWGHSSLEDSVAFAERVEANNLALFHHDPSRDDTQVEAMLEHAGRASRRVKVMAAAEGTTFDV
jgi:phosphoribosyl 1,2-cyclic phosphodiesterase